MVGTIDSSAEEADGLVGLIVQLDPADPVAAKLRLEGAGIPVLHEFQSRPAVYVRVPEAAVESVGEVDGVVYVEREAPVTFLLDTARAASRTELATNPTTGLKDGAGNVIDGRGVGVAVVDTGIDATHPDLTHRLVSSNFAVTENFKVVSASHTVDMVPMITTDQTSGHGTHVTGIVGGRGVEDPAMRGVAPGAVIFGLGVGEASTTLWTNQGLDWVLINHATASPRIRVVTNSWMTGTTYDPASFQSRLVNDLVTAGVVVVFAAGNNGGNGATSQTNGACLSPNEGVLCVASYSDKASGTRDGVLAASSSRGATSDLATWPDLSAPGVAISSTVPPFGTTTLTGRPIFPYRELSGTSMAAPHVAGVIALMLQADARLTPAQVESFIETTAYHFTDQGSYTSSADPRYNGSHIAKGHGLVDAYAAVQKALA